MIYCKMNSPSNHPYGMIFDEKVYAWVAEYMRKDQLDWKERFQKLKKLLIIQNHEQ